MALATGQITIVDLTDLPSLQGYLTSNVAKSQFLSTGGTYTPNWASTPYLLISAELYAVGSGSNLIEDTKVTAISWYKDGVEITANGGGITLVPAATGNLKNTSIKIDQNLMTAVSPTLKITCVVSYKHTSTVDATPVKMDMDFILGQQGQTGSGGAAGLNALTVIMSNESCNLPADQNGSNVNYTNSGTTIRLFEGTTELTYDNVGTSNSTWKVTASGTGITAGSVTDSGTFATIGNHSAITVDNAKVVYTITGKRANGTAISLTREQSVTRTKAGTDAKSLDLSGPQVFKYNEVGAVTPSSIVITAERKNFTGGTYTWTYGLDGAAPTTALNTTNFPGVTFAGDTATITAASTGWGSAKSMTIKAVNSGVSDTITISKIQDGAYAYLLTLEATANTMVFDYLGNAKPAGQTITFTAVNNNIPEAISFAAVQVNAAGTETAFTGLTGTGNTRNLAIGDWPATAVRIKVTATAGSYSDSVTVIKIQEAGDAFSGFLTNESITLACDKDGNVIGTLSALTTGTFKTFLGTTALASGVTYALDTGHVNCTGTIHSSTGVYSLSTLTGDTASLKIKATHTASGAVLNKVVSVSKSKVGETGIQGPNGNDAVTLVTWAPDGDVFKNIAGVTPGPLKIQADLYKGGAVQTTGVTYQWFIQTGTASDDGIGGGWDIINATTAFDCTGYTTNTLVVPASAVPSIENFTCKATYSGKSYLSAYTLTDMTDPYQIVVQSTGGTTFFNGGGANKTLRAAVFQNGQEINDDVTAKFNYSWTKYVGGVMQGAAGSAGTTKSIQVTAASIDSEATYVCDISYK